MKTETIELTAGFGYSHVSPLSELAEKSYFPLFFALVEGPFVVQDATQAGHLRVHCATLLAN